MNQTKPVETQGLRRPQKQIQKRTLLLSWHSGVVAGALQQSQNDTGGDQASEAHAAEIFDHGGDITNYIAIKRSLVGTHENSHAHAKSKQTNRNACQSSDRLLYRTDDVTHHILHRKKLACRRSLPNGNPLRTNLNMKLTTDSGTALPRDPVVLASN